MTLVYCTCEFCGHKDKKVDTCPLDAILLEPGGCRNYKSVRYKDKGGETSEQQPE